MASLEFDQLLTLYRNVLHADVIHTATPMIYWCDRTKEGNYQHFGGFAAATVDLLQLDAQRESLFPVLIVGMYLPSTLTRVVQTSRKKVALQLLDWPGAEYLRYDVTPDELRAAAKRVIEGAKQPLPEHLWRLSELLVQLAKIRHWLENRRINVTGMLKDFRSTLDGDVISSFHLNPQPAISADHLKMVNRLWAYEALAAELAPDSGGVAPLRAAMTDFEQAWPGFEKARAIYRRELESGGAGNDQIESVTDQLEKVIAAVSITIDATLALDAALQRKR